MSFDVVVIGAGLVGAAVARELAGFELSVAVLEARGDVGDGTSKANTAILHTGFDAGPGTLESRLVARGYQLLSEYAAQTGIPVERTGAVLVAWTEEELAALPGLGEKARANGYRHTELISAEAVYAQVPDLASGVLGGLTVPDESITCTWTTNLALATDAVNRGVTLLRNARVHGVIVGPEVTTLETDQGTVTSKWVVNAAGLGADRIDEMFGHRRFSVVPRRGELLVYDKLARPLANRIVLPVPSSKGKGVLISPTVYGNVMLGPTAEDLTDRSATRTSRSGFDFLRDKGAKLMPKLLAEEVTASYAGLRAAITVGDSPEIAKDYLIEIDAAQRYLVLGGIRSTGLTAGMAIAEHVRDLLSNNGVQLDVRPELPDPPQMPNLGEAFTRPYQDAERIAADPEYGSIVCFCERVTAGEIRDAYSSVVPPSDLSGLRRRTRVLNGRCQGFFCGAEVSRLAAGHGKAAL